jgi:predicted Zn-dependent protease
MPRMKRLATFLALFCIAMFASAPAMAQTILRDAETESMLADISRPIIQAAGLSPNNVKVILIQDNSINAFVAGGQIVYIHSGLIDKADNANEVQGVIAHELGHVVGGHAVFNRDGGYGGISILSLLLGAAAIAAGSPEAGSAILMAGQRAAIGKYLAFSRSQESSADAAGARFLNTAGISGRGLIEFFKKLQNLQFSYGYYASNPDLDPFAQTHPMSGERIQTLTADLAKSTAWNTPTDPALEIRFKRVQAKLRGFVNDPEQTLQLYPANDQSMYAHYARAYAYHRKGYPDQAAAETDALIKQAPNDPYFLELQGQIMLESGDPQGALAPLRRATELSQSNPLIATTFGHALIATEDPANLAEAERILRTAVARDTQNPFAWYQLGMVYERKGDTARVALATAVRANLMGDARTELASSRAAMAELPQGSRDWIRAQDIMMVSQTAMEEQRRNGGRQQFSVGAAAR